MQFLQDYWFFGPVVAVYVYLLVNVWVRVLTALRTRYLRCPKCGNELYRVPMYMLGHCKTCDRIYEVERKPPCAS